MFRDDKKDKFMKMKVTPGGPFNIFISHQENVGKNKHSLEFLESKIKFGYFEIKRGKNKYNQLEELEWGSLEDSHGIWILLQSNKLHVGSWNIDDGFATLGAFKVADLSEMRFLGFSSSKKTDWIVGNGTNSKGITNRNMNIFLVSPVGKIFFPNETTTSTFAVTKCTENVWGGLPDWVTVPANNLSMSSCQHSESCPVEFGKLPLQAVSEETVSFSLYRDLFGDALKSFGSGALSIGDSLIVYCSHPGGYFIILSSTQHLYFCQGMFLTRLKTLLAVQPLAWLQSV